MTNDGYKKVPIFWWDFEWDEEKDIIYSVIVESDHPDYPVVAVFHKNNEYTGNWGYWNDAVDSAVKVVDDLYAGRISMKEAKKKYL